MLKYFIIAMLANTSKCANLGSRYDTGSVVVVGLNPALQRTVTLSTCLEVGSVNRASSVQVIAWLILEESAGFQSIPLEIKPKISEWT